MVTARKRSPEAPPRASRASRPTRWRLRPTAQEVYLVLAILTVLALAKGIVG